MQTLPLLALSDFDGTVADTFIGADSGKITVGQAYKRSVADVFGSGGSDVYREIGGLGNRDVYTLVVDLLSHGPQDELADSAYRYIHQQGPHLDEFAGDGNQIRWNDRVSVPLNITRALTAQKLSYLLPQIDESWPKPCKGFLDFYDRLTQINHTEENALIDFGILTSGHTRFINRTFETWGRPVPDLLITADDVSNNWNRFPDPVERFKPGLWQYQVIREQWLRQYGLGGDFNAVQLSQPRTLYIGDSRHHDGGLSERARISFAHFDNTRGVPSFTDHRSLRFGDWNILREVIEDPDLSRALREGSPLFETMIQHESYVPRIRGETQ